MKLEQLFDIVNYRSKEDKHMSKKEIELIDIICSDRDPEYALALAIDIIFDVATQTQVSQSPRPVCSQKNL